MCVLWMVIYGEEIEKGEDGEGNIKNPLNKSHKLEKSHLWILK